MTAPDRVVLLLALVPYLLEHGETPLARLAEAFDIEVEALRGLIEFLGTAGVPGETSTYQDEDLFDIDWDALETRDLVRLTRVVAVDDAPRFSAGEQSALIAGLHSLLPLLPEGERGHARSAAEKLAAAAGDPAYEPPISVTADPDDERAAIIAQAIETGHRVGFAYRDLRGAESERRVDPLELSQHGAGWYLRGFCLERGGERTFLLDAMRGVRALDEPATPPESSRTPSIGPSEAELPAIVRVRDAALHRIAAFSPQPLGPASGGTAEPGWQLVLVQLAYPAAAVRLVQAAPGGVTVESPAEARSALREWAGRALAAYDG